MAILLSESDIRFLKELKAAGENGRVISEAAPRGRLLRLVRVFYVSERGVSTGGMRYVITPAGRDALNAVDDKDR
jgi:hypothetical protein